jgi:hypothetical protein
MNEMIVTVVENKLTDDQQLTQPENSAVGGHGGPRITRSQ